MPKTLKLAKLETYVSPLTNNTVINKGETIKVSNEAAAHILSTSSIDKEGNAVAHWVEHDGDDEPTHTFLSAEEHQLEASRAQRTPIEEGTAEGPAVKTVTRTTQRKPRS